MWGADRQAVWMSAQGANLRITGFDPDSVLKGDSDLASGLPGATHHLFTRST